MKNTIVTLLAAGFAIASCSMNEINDGLVSNDTKTIYASTEAETKTSLGGNEDGIYKVSWSEGDQIVLLDERGFTATYEAVEGGKPTAQFDLKKGPEDMDFKNGIIAGYPVENIYLNSPDPRIPVFVTIPSIQEYKEDTFADNVMPMISDVTTERNLKFNNAAGVIRFMISSSEEITVKSISVNSATECISGVCGYIPETKTYFFDEDLNSGNCVKLSCGEGVTVNTEAKPFMIVVPHQEYTELEVVVKTDDGYEQSFKMKSDRKLTIKRSSVATIPLHVDNLVESDDDSADIQFEPYSVEWSYRYYDRGTEHSRYFNTEDQAELTEWKADNNGAAPYFNYPEIKIASYRVRIDQLEDTTPDADIHEIDFRIDRANERIDIRAYDPEGNEIEYGADGTTPFLNGSHFISLDVLTSDVAKLTEVNLPFVDFPVTYKARKYVVNHDNMMKYSIAFDITLGATPEAKEIDLGSFSIPYTQANVNKIPVTPITKAVAANAEAFADLPVRDAQNFAATVGPWNDTWTRESWNQKDYGYLELRSTDGYNTISYFYNPQTSDIEEDAYLEIPQGAEYGESYDLEETWSFYGIEYTFKAHVECKRPGYRLVPNPKFVKNGVVELTGKVVYPHYSDGSYNGVGESPDDEIPDKYALDMINLREYVNVEGMSQLDKLYDELQINYKVKETRSDDAGYTAPYGVSFVKGADPAVLSISQWPYNAYYDADDNYVELIDDVTLYWDSVDQYPDNTNPYETINEIEVEYQLLSHDGKIEFGDPLTFKLIVPELLKFETTETLTESWKNNDVNTVTNIYKALKITDTKTGKQINNPDATCADDFYDYTYVHNNRTVTKENVGNIYDIRIIPNESNVKAYLKSGIALTANDYIFDPVSGNVQLANNSGNITENVIIEIPVAMYHMYQSTHTHNVTVMVEFTK